MLKKDVVVAVGGDVVNKVVNVVVVGGDVVVTILTSLTSSHKFTQGGRQLCEKRCCCC